MDYCNITPNTLKYIFIGFKNTTRVAKCSGYLDSRHQKFNKEWTKTRRFATYASHWIIIFEDVNAKIHCCCFYFTFVNFTLVHSCWIEHVICNNITNANELLIFHLLICMVTQVLAIPLLHLHFNNEYFITSNYQKKNRYRLYLLYRFSRKSYQLSLWICVFESWLLTLWYVTILEPAINDIRSLT